jgi:multidrug efflux pump subunit AcrA (membrane-fusion protein)
MAGKPARATFKRNEIFKIGQLVENALTPPGAARTYQPEQSDATVAVAASAALKRDLTADDIRRVRLQVHGKLAGEGRESAEMIGRILQAQAAQAVLLKKLEARIAEIERSVTEPEPRQMNGTGHGYVAPRPHR